MHNCDPSCQKAATNFAVANEIDAIRHSRLKHPHPKPDQYLNGWEKTLEGALSPKDRRDLRQSDLYKKIRSGMTPGEGLQLSLESARDDIVEHIPGDVPDWLSSIPVCITTTRDPNACVMRGPNGHPIITVDYGFVTSINRMARLFIVSFDITNPFLRKGGPGLGSMLSSEGFRSLVQGMEFTRREVVNGEVFDPPLTVKVEGQDRIQSGLIAAAILDFVIAHEIGHVFWDHLSNSETRTLNIGKGEQSFYRKSWDQEFEADDFGTTMFKVASRNHPDIVHAAPLMLMKYFEFLEAGNANRPKNSHSHPPPIERYERIEQQLPLEGSNAMTYLKQFKLICNCGIAAVQTFAKQ